MWPTLTQPQSTPWIWIGNAADLLTITQFVLLAGIAVWGWRHRFRLLLRYRGVGDSADGRRRFRCVVFLVSRAEQAFWIMDHHDLDSIGLIYTDFSQAAADRVISQAQRRGILVRAQRLLEDPDDPALVRELTREVLLQIGAESRPRGLAVEVTGGKIPMSLGAFMAASELGVEVVYIRHHLAGKRAIPDHLVTLNRP